MNAIPATITEKAQILGMSAAAGYWNEFAEEPIQNEVGDWDSSAWHTAWRELCDEGATDEDYDGCLENWRWGFFGRT